MERTHALLPLLGRLMMATIFLVSGFNKLLNYEATAGYMAGHGLPVVQVLLILTIVIEIGGGLLLALGLRARTAALVLVLFLVPTTLVFHAFWAVPAEHFQGQLNHFLKNLAILGGLLYVVAHGPGVYRIGRRERRLF